MKLLLQIIGVLFALVVVYIVLVAAVATIIRLNVLVVLGALVIALIRSWLEARARKLRFDGKAHDKADKHAEERLLAMERERSDGRQ